MCKREYSRVSFRILYEYIGIEKLSPGSRLQTALFLQKPGLYVADTVLSASSCCGIGADTMISIRYDNKDRRKYTIIHSDNTGSGLYLTTAIFRQAYTEPLFVNR